MTILAIPPALNQPATTLEPERLEGQPGPYLHLIADVGAHRHRPRYLRATGQVLKHFRPDKALALEIGRASIRYALPRRRGRDETATPADRPDVAVFLTDAAGDLSHRAHTYLLRLTDSGVPLWRVIPLGEDGVGVHPSGSYRFEVRQGVGWSYVHVELVSW